MPIRRHHRWLYPIDWRELSGTIRFRRAQGRCEGCGRPHGRLVLHLGDGRWWDEELGRWRDGAGKTVRRLEPPHSIILTADIPAWCWRPVTGIMTRRTTRPPTSPPSASGAICCTTGPSTSGAGA